jgi:hypothetical protein
MITAGRSGTTGTTVGGHPIAEGILLPLKVSVGGLLLWELRVRGHR